MQGLANDGDTRKAWTFHDDLISLQSDVLNRLVKASLVAGVLWFLQFGLSDNIPPWTVVALPPLLIVCSLFSDYLSRSFNLRLGAVTYIITLSFILLAAAFGYATPTLLVFLALPVGVASLLLGASFGLLATGSMGVLLLAITHVAPLLGLQPSVVAETVSYAILMALLMATLLWIAFSPLETTLKWAWTSYQVARDQTEAARTHQGELTRALANLDVAYRRLEIMNVELERAREAAIEARRLKAEFAANISHELRTPLNMIIGFSEMMVMSPQSYDNQPLPTVYRGDLQTIHRNAKHLSQLIDDVLDLSQIETARMGLIRELTSLADVISEATGAVTQSFKTKGLSIDTELPSHLPQVAIDRTRIRQVFINLLNNASRFTDQGGVTITAEARDGNLVAAVADTGIGIGEEDLPKLFEEFRQLDGSIRRRAGGSGLGLSISRKLVELHGGKMWVNSKLGAGTTIYFSLPLGLELSPSHAAPAWELRPDIGTPLSQQESVVVVSKEARTAGIFQRYLDDYRVQATPSLADAWKLADQEQMHAVITTVSPGDMGWLGPKSVQSGHYGIPVVAIALRGSTISGQQMPVFAYLTKPILQDQFLSVLESLGDNIRNLLIVDDDPDAVRLLSRMAKLATRHYRVTRALGGEQALETMSRQRPDAVVLDLLMPGVDGYAVIETMQGNPRLRNIPVIVVTARGREQETITVDAVGFTRSEGFSVGEMIECVKAALDAL